MTQYKKSRRSHIRWDRLAIIMAGIIVIVAGVFVGIKMLAANPYEKYDAYNEKTKLYGELQHDSQKEEDVYYLSVHYPEYQEKAMNDLVANYRKKHVKVDKKHSGMQYIMVDYDSKLLYDSYITLTFHQVIKDENDKVLKKEDVSYNYDIKRKKLMDVKDVLRRDYIVMMKKLAKENGFKEDQIKIANLNSFILQDKKVSFYFDANASKTLDVVYEDHKPYIALTNAKIPSYYMKDPIIPAAQPAVKEGKKLIAFTFDDGPASENTKAIMDEFEKYGGRATFFMLGQNADLNPDLVKEVYKRGHEVGNHSWDHSQGIAVTNTLTKKQVSEEVYKPNDVIFKATGFEPRYFRPPYGAIGNTLDSVCGLDMVGWDIDSLDWQNHNPEIMTSIIKKGASVGYEVVLMHDIHKETVEGVKKVLKELDAQGFQFVTIDTLMKQDRKYLTAYNNERMHNIVITSNVGK